MVQEKCYQTILQLVGLWDRGHTETEIQGEVKRGLIKQSYSRTGCVWEPAIPLSARKVPTHLPSTCPQTGGKAILT